MTHLDQRIADSLAQSSDTVVHQLASEVVRLRGAITDALRTLYEGGHIYAKPLEDAIRKPAENLFHKNCRSCICWNGDLCELISHICENGEQWRPSAEFVATNPEVAALADFAERMREDASRLRSEIADLKRGGVVVPELLAETTLALIAIDWPNRTIDTIATARNIREWFRESARPIPADRVLGEGDRVVGREEWMYLAALERYARKHGPESIQDVIGCLDHLRANQGGVAT